MNTNINQQFHDRARSTLVTVRVHTSSPRQTAHIKEADLLLEEQAGAKAKTSFSLIPTDLQKEDGKIRNTLKRTISSMGWLNARPGKGMEFTIPVDKLQAALDVIETTRKERTAVADSYIKSHDLVPTTAWDNFRAKCLSSAGEFEVPLNKFPYVAAADYIAEFETQAFVEAMADNASSALPPQVVERIAADACQQLDRMLDQIRRKLADECRDLLTVVGGETAVSRRTFNALRTACESADAIVGDTAPDVSNFCRKFPHFLDNFDDFKVFGPATTNNDLFDAAKVQTLRSSLETTAFNLESSCITTGSE